MSSSTSENKNDLTTSKFPFSLEELNEVLRSFNSDDLFSQQYQAIRPETEEHLASSRLETLTDSAISRAFSSSSSNSSLAPQYV